MKSFSLLLAATLLALVCVVSAQAPAAPSAEKTLRAFHIGNSLTYQVVSDPKYNAFLSGQGVKFESGYHVLWGQSLFNIWNNVANPSAVAAKYGTFQNALANFDWDILTLQSWGAQFDGEKGDVVMAKKFIELAITRNPAIQVYIYETWPYNGPDYAAKWNREFPKPGNWDSVWNSTYCPQLVAKLNEELPNLQKPVKLIPAGSVIAAIDPEIRDGKLSAIQKTQQIYKDDVHLTPFAYYIVRCTFYAVLRNQSPQGLPTTEMFKDVSPEDGKVIQDTVWRVVSGKPK